MLYQIPVSVLNEKMWFFEEKLVIETVYFR